MIFLWLMVYVKYKINKKTSFCETIAYFLSHNTLIFQSIIVAFQNFVS